MKHLKIKETYLIFLIVIGLVSLSLYSTYALFTANTEINDVVSFSTQLTTDSSILEYEMVTIPAGESKVVELVVNNSHEQSLYYGVWYQALTDVSDINIGLYTQENNTPASGTIAADSSATILIGITNNGTSDAILNIGVAGSETSNLNLASNRTLITGEWTSEIIVTDEYLQENTIIPKETINLEYSTANKTQVSLYPGEYKLEVWGAQGGSYNTTYVGGKGGYSYGTLTLTETTTLYVYPGGKGTDGTTSGTFSGGFNGGGQSYSESTNLAMSAGGGASDIRIGTDSLYARVIVAGGGGGAGSYSSSRRYSGGAGGGENGLAGSQYSVSYPGGAGGSTTSAGNSYSNNTNINSTYYGTPADFGNGGSAKSGVTSISGGGGGWYGGGYAANAGAGGGSGYVYTSETASNYPSGCLLNSSYYLTNAETISGNSSFVDFDGSVVIGHSGNGAARISGIKYSSYSIPVIYGLDDLVIKSGENIDLTIGVNFQCENSSTNCVYLGPNITDTSSFSVGSHTIYYEIKDSNGKKYNYPRIIRVVENHTSAEMLVNLGLTTTSGTPTFSKTSCSSGCGENTVGIYSTSDDLGTSYYFRGNVTNNYVKFGKWSNNTSDVYYGYSEENNLKEFNTLSECQNDSTYNSSCTLISRAGKDMYWRILRINGDGTIRMIYDGTNAYSNGVSSLDRQIGISAYNNDIYDHAYFGYMYGTVGSSDYATTHANLNNSLIKSYLENWYMKNLIDYSSYISDAIYCNDRKLSSKSTSYYAFLERYYNNWTTPYTYSPTLICNQTNDKFTVSTDLGNGNLVYPVGLITKDEEIFAGGIPGSINSKYYLYMNHNFWSLTPQAYGSPGSGTYHNFCGIELTANGEGTTNGALHVNNVLGVRPVISLGSYLNFTGTGTASDPYIPVLP